MNRRPRIQTRVIGGVHRFVQGIRRMYAAPTIESAQTELAYRDSQEFIYSVSGPHTLSFGHTSELRRHCLKTSPSTGALLEFGVFKGDSINAFARQLKTDGDARIIHGFDSFTGFSEEWTGMNKEFGMRRFDTGGRQPLVEDNVRLVAGIIESSLPEFLATAAIDRVAFVHIDTDTYSPAKAVLTNLKPYLRSGTIVLFDELCGYPNWRSHEFRALSETIPEHEYDFIGFAHGGRGANLIKAAIRFK